MADPLHIPGQYPEGAVLDGNYVILGLLGRGGIASVYKALQTDLDRPVALKCITYTSDNQRIVDNLARRLAKEARAAARIRHRNIVTVHAFRSETPWQIGDRQGTTPQPFMVMELLEGHTLAKALISGPLDPSRAKRLTLDALDALARAHEMGIVHKDLKPDNLFITHPGTRRESLVITDFGTVRDGEVMTFNDSLPMTPNYVAPEYLSEKLVSPALDVYQMGLILTEMLTGHPVVPHKAIMDCIRAHMTGDLPIPEALKAGHLGHILQNALALDPNARIPNAEIFFKVLRQVDMGAIHLPNARDAPDEVHDTQVE